MRQGWIVNVSRDDDSTRLEARDQREVFDLDGEPVFEVWFWHALTRRWWVMSYARDPRLEAQGVVFFSPEDVPERLRERVRTYTSDAHA